MKTTGLKRKYLLMLLLFVSGAAAFGLSSGAGGDSMASFFVDSSTGNHVDSQGNVWYVPGFNYEDPRINGSRAKVFYHRPLDRSMVLTKVMSSDPAFPPTCDLACNNLTGSNGEPMRCVDNVSSFPYLGTAGGKLFYPHANTLISRFPGHGAHGGNYDIICLAGSSQGNTGACSGTFGDTISTCPQCGKNLDPNETLAPPSTFSDGAIVACAEGIAPVKATSAGSGTITSSYNYYPDEACGAEMGYTCPSNIELGACPVGHVLTGIKYYDEAGSDHIDGIGTVCTELNASGALGNKVYNNFYPNNPCGPEMGDCPAKVFGNECPAGSVVTGVKYYSNVNPGSDYTEAVGFVCQNLSGGGSTDISLSGRITNNYVPDDSCGPETGDCKMIGSHECKAGSAVVALQYYEYGISPPDKVDGLGVRCAQVATSSSSEPVVAKPAAVSSTEVNGAFIVEVGPGQTGTSQCAQHNKICLGGALTNRTACMDFYPHALKNNESSGYASSFKCTGGSTKGVEPCVGTLEDTCSVAVSTGEVFGCDELIKDGVDSAFIECADPFSPTLLNEVGGFLPPISTPSVEASTGLVPYTVNISHPLQQATTVSVAYRLVGETETHLATLHPGSGAADVSQGTADQDTTLSVQIGSVDAVDTDAFSEVAVNFNWDPRTDLNDTSGTYVLVITVIDETGNTTTDISPEFTLDFSGVTVDAGAPIGSFDDIDGDGVLNDQDPDIDGDGIANVWDEDIDGDGQFNNQDNDDDGDNISDDSDDNPSGIGSVSDIDGDGVLNGSDPDIDGDGLLNGVDPDIDGDGIPNGQDSDIDGDGILNSQDPDMDGDGVLNGDDSDMDADGLLNGEDPDVDGDGIANGEDPDVDGDGILNADDGDIDGDGILNGEDLDVDGDGLLNGEDPDVDGDGIANVNDPDVDGDGILNGEDPDVDGDGLLNGEDSDVDGDGIINEQDGDVDGDGLPNADDGDIDGDGTQNTDDSDSDGDGVSNEEDQFPAGRRSNVGVPEDPAESGLKGAAENCFEDECTQDQKIEFFEDLIEKRQSGLLGDSFQGVEQNIVDFIVRLYENGYTLEELTGSVISRRLAIDIAAEVLLLRGNITQEILNGVHSDHYPDVSNTTRSGKAINLLSDLGIIAGFPDGFFHEMNSTTFVQAAKIIVNTAAHVSVSQIGSVLEDVIKNDGTMDWFFPFLKTLDQLNVTLISEKVGGYQDYEKLGLDIDLIEYLRLFDKLSEVIGIDDILSFDNGIGLG